MRPERGSHSMTIDELMRLIDAETTPDRVSAGQALEFLQELRAELDGRIDGLRDDVRLGADR
jgi:hypothetical protein